MRRKKKECVEKAGELMLIIYPYKNTQSTRASLRQQNNGLVIEEKTSLPLSANNAKYYEFTQWTAATQPLLQNTCSSSTGYIRTYIEVYW